MADTTTLNESDGGSIVGTDVIRGVRGSAMKKFVLGFLDALGNIVGQIRIRTNAYANLISVIFENGELAWSTDADSDGFRHLFAGDNTTTGGQQIFPPRGDKFSPTNYLWPSKAINITVGGVDPMPLIWLGIDDILIGLYTGGLRIDLVSSYLLRCRLGTGLGASDRALTLDWWGPIQADSFAKNVIPLTGTSHLISAPGRYRTTNGAPVSVVLDGSIQEIGEVELMQGGAGLVTVTTNDASTMNGLSSFPFNIQYDNYSFQRYSGNYDVR